MHHFVNKKRKKNKTISFFFLSSHRNQTSTATLLLLVEKTAKNAPLHTKKKREKSIDRKNAPSQMKKRGGKAKNTVKDTHTEKAQWGHVPPTSKRASTHVT